MHIKLLRRRYCAQDYGGQPFTEIQRTIARNVMYFRDLVNRIEGMRCPSDHKELCRYLTNGK
jgi:hypothetical protein